jgi:predicted ribosomally synthesized peptide with SipW-like signal peptide
MIKKRFDRLWFICLGLVVALAVSGIGYAHWSQQLTIESTITTGTWCEGCSHGFWKNHEDDWEATGYNTTDDFDITFSDDAFECDAFDPDITLMEALWLKGGGLNALAREAVGALLNAAHPDVDYALTVGEVVDKVQEAIETEDYETAKDELEEHNAKEPGGCPLGG